MALGLAGVMAARGAQASLSVTLTEAGGNADGGGLFQAVTSGNGTFDTFCVSIVTTIQAGTKYTYDYSSTIDADTPPAVPTYIAEGTAYIYNQFLNDNAAFGGNLKASGESATLDDVQATIWYLQGLLVDKWGNYGDGGTYDPNNGQNLASDINAILPTLEKDSDLTLAQLEANGKGAYGIVAMNVFSGSQVKQPQLARVPEAPTIIAGALLLLPLGASAWRNLRKQEDKSINVESRRAEMGAADL
jgi:hypothetical protein